MTASRERGFTLIELVLALSIVAAMLAIVFGGLRVAIRAWQSAMLAVMVGSIYEATAALANGGS